MVPSGPILHTTAPAELVMVIEPSGLMDVRGLVLVFWVVEPVTVGPLMIPASKIPAWNRPAVSVPVAIWPAVMVELAIWVAVIVPLAICVAVMVPRAMSAAVHA